MSSPRKVMFITGSRGEWGYIRPILHLIEADPEIDYEIVATNMHLLPEFGTTVKEIKKAGFRVKYEPAMTLAGYTPATMMKSLSLFGISVTDILESDRPDIILLAGDRGEQFMAAMAGAHMNIAVAHIQAGEVSGNIDGQTRHAIARYTNIHFAANQDAADRLERSGEQKFRIHNVGAPQLDEFLQGAFINREAVYETYRLDAGKPYLLVAQHPVTEEVHLAGEQMEAMLAAISEIGMQTVLIQPNSDAGSTAIRSAIEKYRRPFIHVHRNVPRENYAGLMANAAALVGNSSSGLLEAPSFALPAVNIGRRQQGRVQGANVINCGFDALEIETAVRRALNNDFKKPLEGMQNPYGDGHSSERIVEALKSVIIDEKMLKKEITY